MLFALRDITKTYGSITALSALTADASVGAIGLLGPNGAGKTTLIRALLGLISIDSGSGEVLGLNLKTHGRAIRGKVGFMPENDCLFPGVSGVEFVAFSGELCGMTRSCAMQRAHETLNYVDLGEARYRQAETYSTGMRQRLKLASALVHDPQFLILDEPTNGMDPVGRQEMLDLARDLAHGKEMSVMFSSHLLPDVEYVCDQVIVLSQGKLVTQGLIQELKEVHANCFVVRTKVDQAAFAARLRERGCEATTHEDELHVRLPADASERTLWALAAETGEQIRRLRPQRSTLEDVFLRALGQ